MQFILQSIEHKDQRYDTVGDWTVGPRGEYTISVSNHLVQDEQFLIMLHEMIEAYLCTGDNITQQQVDEFDLQWLKDHAGPKYENDEPGDDPKAPYGKQHRKAMIIEHLVANMLGRHSYGMVRGNAIS